MVSTQDLHEPLLIPPRTARSASRDDAIASAEEIHVTMNQESVLDYEPVVTKTFASAKSGLGDDTFATFMMKIDVLTPALSNTWCFTCVGAVVLAFPLPKVWEASIYCLIFVILPMIRFDFLIVAADRLHLVQPTFCGWLLLTGVALVNIGVAVGFLIHLIGSKTSTIYQDLLFMVDALCPLILLWGIDLCAMSFDSPSFPLLPWAWSLVAVSNWAWANLVKGNLVEVNESRWYFKEEILLRCLQHVSFWVIIARLKSCAQPVLGQDADWIQWLWVFTCFWGAIWACVLNYFSDVDMEDIFLQTSPLIGAMISVGVLESLVIAYNRQHNAEQSKSQEGCQSLGDSATINSVV